MICLATPRLLLRTWRAEDRSDLEALLDGRSPSHGNLPDVGPADAAIEPVDALGRAWISDGFGVFALESLDDGRLVGLAGLLQAEARHGRSLDLVWRLGDPEYSLAPEALIAVIDWAFGLLDVDRIAATAPIDDQASADVAEAAGLTLADRTLEAATNTWVNRFAITASQWNEVDT